MLAASLAFIADRLNVLCEAEQIAADIAALEQRTARNSGTIELSERVQRVRFVVLTQLLNAVRVPDHVGTVH